MIKMLILICAVGLSRAECQPDVARVVMTGPLTDNAIACMFTGQAYLAGSAIEVAEGEYVKVLCQTPGPRPKVATVAAGR